MNKYFIISALLLVLLIAGFFVFQPTGTTPENPDVVASSDVSDTTATRGWERYEDTERGFSFAYPSDWYVFDEGDYALLSVSPIGPDDPRRPSGISLASSFTVGLLQEESIEAHIQNVADVPHNDNFTASEITLDTGETVTFLSYGTPYGSAMNESFITLNNGAVLHIWFSSTDETYMQILRSFRWQ